MFRRCCAFLLARYRPVLITNTQMCWHANNRVFLLLTLCICFASSAAVSLSHTHTHTYLAADCRQPSHPDTVTQKRTGVRRTVARRSSCSLRFIRLHSTDYTFIESLLTSQKAQLNVRALKGGGGIHPVGGGCSGCGWSQDGERVKGSGQPSKTSHYKNSREKPCQQYDWHVSVIWKKKKAERH